MWAGSSFIILGVLIVTSYYARPEVLPSYNGTLKVGSILDKSLLQVGKGVQFGSSGMIFRTNKPQSTPIVKIFDNSDLTVETVNGKIAVSNKIFDASGKLVAEIRRNEWKVAPSPLTWDRNYNKNALEVRSPSGDVVLQVKLLPDVVQIQGEWYGSRGNGIRIVESTNLSGMSVVSFVHLPETTSSPGPKIAPIFVYPSDGHLGQLVNPE